MKRFLDGDFIEVLLEMQEVDQLKVVNAAKERLEGGFGQGFGVKEVRMLIEELR